MKTPRGSFRASSRQQREASLAQAEAKLVEFAASLSNDSLDIVTYDTEIPASSVPIRRRKGEEVEEGKEEDYLMHAVRVTNKSKLSPVLESQTPPLVLLHGFMCGLCYWYRSFVSLARVFPEIYALDMLGFGLSSRPKWPRRPENEEDAAIAEEFFVESLEAWRAANKIDRMVLVGHSFSGHISVAYCERYPQHVEQLILVCPVGVTDVVDVPCKTEAERIVQQNPHGKEMKAKGTRFSALVYKTLFQAGIVNGYGLRKLPKRVARWWVGRDVRRHFISANREEQEALAEYLYCTAMMPGSGEYTFHRIFRPCLYARNPTQHRIPKLGVNHVAIVHGASDWVDKRGSLQLIKTHNEGRFEANYSLYEIDSGHRPMLDTPKELTATFAKIVITGTPRYLPAADFEECKQ